MSGLIPGICGSEGIEGVPGRPGSCGPGAPGTVGAAGGALPDWGWLWSVPGPAAEVRVRELERRAVLSGQSGSRRSRSGRRSGHTGGAASGWLICGWLGPIQATQRSLAAALVVSAAARGGHRGLALYWPQGPALNS